MAWSPGVSFYRDMSRIVQGRQQQLATQELQRLQAAQQLNNALVQLKAREDMGIRSEERQMARADEMWEKGAPEREQQRRLIESQIALNEAKKFGELNPAAKISESDKDRAFYNAAADAFKSTRQKFLDSPDLGYTETDVDQAVMNALRNSDVDQLALSKFWKDYQEGRGATDPLYYETLASNAKDPKFQQEALSGIIGMPTFESGILDRVFEKGWKGDSNEPSNAVKANYAKWVADWELARQMIDSPGISVAQKRMARQVQANVERNLLVGARQTTAFTVREKNETFSENEGDEHYIKGVLGRVGQDLTRDQLIPSINSMVGNNSDKASVQSFIKSLWGEEGGLSPSARGGSGAQLLEGQVDPYGDTDEKATGEKGEDGVGFLAGTGRDIANATGVGRGQPVTATGITPEIQGDDPAVIQQIETFMSEKEIPPAEEEPSRASSFKAVRNWVDGKINQGGAGGSLSRPEAFHALQLFFGAVEEAGLNPGDYKTMDKIIDAYEGMYPDDTGMRDALSSILKASVAELGWLKLNDSEVRGAPALQNLLDLAKSKPTKRAKFASSEMGMPALRKMLGPPGQGNIEDEETEDPLPSYLTDHTRVTAPFNRGLPGELLRQGVRFD